MTSGNAIVSGFCSIEDMLGGLRDETNFEFAQPHESMVTLVSTMRVGNGQAVVASCLLGSVVSALDTTTED